MEVVTGKRQELPTAEAVETSVRSVPPEGFEPPTFGSGEQTIGFISALLVLILSIRSRLDVSE